MLHIIGDNVRNMQPHERVALALYLLPLKGEASREFR